MRTSQTIRLTRLSALIGAMLLPLGSVAAEADLQQRLDAMAREIEAIKAAQQKNVATTEQLQRSDAKGLGRWLTVGGDYQFRVDRLSGETRSFTDVNATFGNAEQQLQAAFFSNPTPATGANLVGMMNFAAGMAGVQTYDQAQAFLQGNAAMLGALSGFAVQVPAQKPKNDSLYSNRFTLDLHAKATQDVSVTARLLMYKTSGLNDDSAVTNSGAAPFFADRVGVFDGTLGHVPSSSYLNVDRAYATLSNIAEQDIWFSVGRRPSTHGVPGHLRANAARPGNGGTPALLVDYAFDGMTVGWAPDIESLPGGYGKICYGRGFESGFERTQGNSIKDTDMLGVALVPIDTDPLRVWLQWNRGFNIFDAPKMSNTYFGNTMPKTNLGDIDWYGVGVMGQVKEVAGGTLHYFADAGRSITRPNANVSAQFGFQGLLTGAFFSPEAPTRKTGNAVYLGMRYDLPSRTRMGLEYNRGSKNWITFAPAANDTWTSKVGTRGEVYEAYVIHELDRQPVSSPFSKVFFRLGYQHYDFKYTGSNNWVGAPVAMSEVNGQLMATTPLETADNLYATFEVKF